MNTWPAIAKPVAPMGEDIVYPQVRTPFENGAVQSRSQWSRARRRFTLRWDAMSPADYLLLDAFFLANQGLTFTWTHPVSSTAYTVRFQEDALKSEVVTMDRRRVELILEEA